MIGLLWTMTACPGLPPLEYTDPAPVLVVDAISFDFDTLELGEEATQTLTVTNIGDLELSLELSLEGSPDFTVPSINRPYYLEPEESRTFDVVFSPSSVHSEGTLVLISDDPELPELEIPLVGYGAVPMLVVDPLDYDFGKIPLHCEIQLPIVLENQGGADLTITSIAHSGLGFGLEPFEVPVTLVPGSAIQAWVTVNLNELGPATGQLFVVSDAPSGQVVANQTAEGDELVGGCD